MFNLDRSSVLEDSKKRGLKKDYVDRMVLTLDFEPALLGVHGILCDLQVLTDMSSILKRVLVEIPMISFERPKNLKDNLVRAKLQPLEEKAKGMFCCGKVRYKVCNYVNYVKPGTTFVGDVDKRSFHINHSFHCDSSGVIYLVTCRRCNKQYVTVVPRHLKLGLIIIKVHVIDMGEGREVFVVSICMLIFGRMTLKGWMMYVCRLLTSLTLTLRTRLVGRFFRLIN